MDAIFESLNTMPSKVGLRITPTVKDLSMPPELYQAISRELTIVSPAGNTCSQNEGDGEWKRTRLLPWQTEMLVHGGVSSPVPAITSSYPRPNTTARLPFSLCFPSLHPDLPDWEALGFSRLCIPADLLLRAAKQVKAGGIGILPHSRTFRR